MLQHLNFYYLFQIIIIIEILSKILWKRKINKTVLYNEMNIHSVLAIFVKNNGTTWNGVKNGWE